jgi:long-chain acyl-CoA synthetase
MGRAPSRPACNHRNMASTIADRARTDPEGIALIDGRHTFTWASLDEVVAAAARLIRTLTESSGGRLGVYAANSAELVVAHLGALYAGVGPVVVSQHLGPDEVAYILRDAGVRALLVDAETVERGAAAAERVGVTRLVGWHTGDRRDVESWEGLIAAVRDAAASSAETLRSDLHHGVRPVPPTLYTSGTTGFPKAVEFPVPMFARSATLTEHLAALDRNRFTAYENHLVVGPLHHTGPLNGMRSLAGGTRLVVLGRFDAEQTLAAVESHGVETMLVVPTHLSRMVGLPAEVRARYDLSSLRLITHTGAPCPGQVKRAAIDMFGPILLDAYGATEVGTICTITSPEWVERPTSVGRCIPPFVRAVAVDDADEELPAGEEGRLFFEDSTGRGVVYPGDPAKTAAANLRPGFFTIGEVGFVDDDGYVHLTDRATDMIVSGGVNVYPAEIERVLAEHPEVADVAVVGVPDADLGEVPKALVVARDHRRPPIAEELIAYCADRLARYKCPRSVDIVRTVGRSAMGKLDKRALRASYWEVS